MRKIVGLVDTGIKGTGGATGRTSEVLELLRKKVGMPNLVSGTLNVKLDHPHQHKPDFEFLRAEWPKPETEDWFFEKCEVSFRGKVAIGLILKTTTDYHGPTVLEIMSDKRLKKWFPLESGDEVEITLY
jgi:CTP-dependent riboflavin kinase